jgi:prepilin-type N-terminal cleavage/methylation domain-containing protein
MIPSRGTQQHGFTLIELLIAVVIALLVAGALAAAAPAARTAFDRVPAELDIQQRGRIAIDTLSQALRATYAVWPSTPDASGGFSEVTLATPVPNPAQGVLQIDQPAPGAPMTLDGISCPNFNDLCGFTAGMTALASDPVGMELFMVASVDQIARTITPSAPLSRTFAAGATARQVEQSVFRLDAQSSLVRVTAANAVQPMVDAIADLSFTVAPDRVEVSLTVHAASERLRSIIHGRVFKTSISRRNAS